MRYTPVKYKTTEDREKDFRALFTPILSEELVTRLINAGFLTAPASTKYHGNYEGGLFDHSMNVATYLDVLTVNNKLEWEHKTSPLVVGILHDLCKVDNYKKVIDSCDGDKICSHYEYNNDVLVKGHGIKSVVYAQQLGLELTEEEVACIIYHMGAYTDKEEWKDYNAAVNKYPNVLWTHVADMIASQIMEV